MNRLARISGLLAAAAAIAAAVLCVSAARASEPGNERRWTLDFRTRLEQSGRPVEIHLTGDWIAAVSESTGGGHIAELRLADVQFAGAAVDNAPVGALNDLKARLERPIWGTYRGDGALVALHFYKDMAPTDRNLLEMIATAAQFVMPPGGQGVWTIQERDAAGEYLAVYNRTGVSSVTKRKLKYIDTGGAAGAPAGAMRVEVEQSELRFTLDGDGAVAAVDGSERVKMGLEFGSSGRLAAVTEIHLGSVRRGRSTASIGSLGRAGAETVQTAVVTQRVDPAEAEAERDDRLLERQTTEGLLNAAAAGSGDGTLGDRLVALFRRRPEAAAQAVRILREKGPIRRITIAMGKAASASSTEGLAQLARDIQAPVDVRIEALAAFVEMQHPSREAMAVPQTLMADSNPRVSAEAELISGALARAGREEHRAEADAIDAELVARYRAARDENRIREVVAAMGNSAGPSVVAPIRQALAGGSGPVRASAVKSLRLVRGEEIDETVAAVMTGDKDATVRSDAVFAASFRLPMHAVVGDALVQAARGDSADYVRSAAIGLLRQHPDVSSRTVETLEWVSANDAKPGVRRVAREALAVVKGR